MENLQTLLLIIHTIVAILIVIFVLLQPSSGNDGLVSSSNLGGVMSVRGAGNLLTRITSILIAIFMANTLFLGIIASKKSQKRSIVNEIIQEEQKNKTVPLAE